MPVPVITALPPAPSRSGDPSNFPSESLAFLDAQPDFVSDCNAVGSYLNGINLNPYDWGNLDPPPSVTTGSLATIIDDLPTNPPLTGLPLVSAIDGLLASMVGFVAPANAAAAFIDGVYDPLAAVVVDPARPSIPAVSNSPTRTDGIASFESKSLAFYGSAKPFNVGLQSLTNYVNDVMEPFADWGSIAVSHTSTDDWGFIV
jgi:hypothetical protein